jgi:hypothetical protein
MIDEAKIDQIVQHKEEIAFRAAARRHRLEQQKRARATEKERRRQSQVTTEGRTLTLRQPRLRAAFGRVTALLLFLVWAVLGGIVFFVPQSYFVVLPLAALPFLGWLWPVLRPNPRVVVTEAGNVAVTFVFPRMVRALAAADAVAFDMCKNGMSGYIGRCDIKVKGWMVARVNGLSHRDMLEVERFCKRHHIRSYIAERNYTVTVSG